MEVHGYYGTETGKKAIESFLQEQGIKETAVTYEKEIVNHEMLNNPKKVICMFVKKREIIKTGI